MNAHQEWSEISAAASHKLTDYRQSTASKDRISFMENHAYWCAQVAVERSRGDAPSRPDPVSMERDRWAVQGFDPEERGVAIIEERAGVPPGGTPTNGIQVWVPLRPSEWEDDDRAAYPDRALRVAARICDAVNAAPAPRSAARTVEPVADRTGLINFVSSLRQHEIDLEVREELLKLIMAAPATSPNPVVAENATTERLIGGTHFCGHRVMAINCQHCTSPEPDAVREEVPFDEIDAATDAIIAFCATDHSDARKRGYMRERIARLAVLAALSRPAHGGWEDIVAPCKGEQLKFEEWATGQGYDMTEHPLHYLFIREKTNAARRGWKAALEYVAAALARKDDQSGGPRS